MSGMVEIVIDGATVKPWLYRPDGELLERLEWLTDVIPSFNANEQRVRVREAPRRSFEFAVALEGRDRRTAENVLFSHGAKPFAVPVWMDSEPLAAPLLAGADEIPVTPATRDYVAGGLVGVMTDPRNYEVLEIDSVGPASVTVTAPLAGNWPAHRTTVFPLRVARLPDSQSVSRFTGDVSSGRMQWQCVDVVPYTAAAEPDTYRSYPVVQQPSNWIEDPAQDYVRKVQQLDAGTGRVFVDDEAQGPILLQAHRWLLDGRAQIDAFRQWLYARQGRLTAFWMPSWSQDLMVTANVGSAATTIDVEHCGYTAEIAQAISRRDIRIQLRNGTVYYRRITGSAELDANTERLTINAALGANVSASNIALVSFMHLARLDADAAEIVWWQSDVAEASLSVRGFRNDL